MKNVCVTDGFKNKLKKGTCFVLSTLTTMTLMGNVRAINKEVNEIEEIILLDDTLTVTKGINLYILMIHLFYLLM